MKIAGFCMVYWGLSYAGNFIAAEQYRYVWIVFYVEGCGVSSAEYSVHLVGVNTLSACREFCCVLGKMVQDVGML